MNTRSEHKAIVYIILIVGGTLFGVIIGLVLQVFTEQNVSKTEITRDWLNKNAECIEAEMRCSEQYAKCFGEEENYQKCLKWKLNDVIIEMKE